MTAFGRLSGKLIRRFFGNQLEKERGMNEDFTTYALTRLATVREAVSNLVVSHGGVHQDMPIFIQVYELREAAIERGNARIVEECDFLLNQVLNLCQSDFPKRVSLKETIDAQTHTIQGLLTA